jgi:hypothetical protein
MSLDMNAVEAFAGKVVGDISATFSGVMTNLGHKLGLYKAMAGAGAMTPQTLADRTGTHERYVREWLNNQTAGGYVEYEAEADRYTLPDEHVPVLADEDSPVFLVPALDVASSLWLDEDKVAEIFRTGKGIAWADHHHRSFLRKRSAFPSRIQGTPDHELDQGSRQRRRQAQRGRESGGCGLWSWCLDHRDGQGVSGLDILWFRQP